MEDDKNYTGFYKDFLKGSVRFNTLNNVFSNSECLFCEFNDIISPTWLAIIHNIMTLNPKSLEGIVDINNLPKDFDKLLLWYILRKHRNALLDIKCNNILDDSINLIASNMFNEKYAYYNEQNEPFLLNYAYTLKRTIRTASVIIKKFVIYTEQCNEYVDMLLTKLYGSRVDIRSGNLIGALNDIPNDSTFIFSDIYKVNALLESNKLEGSSIILADGFGYNYNNEIGKDENLKVNVLQLQEKYRFKFNTFDNFRD